MRSQESFVPKEETDGEMMELMERLKCFPELMKEVAGKHGAAEQPAKAEAKAEAAPAKVEEEKKPEKKAFDVELTAIDAAKRLTIIKEFKTLFNLGLKEAKEVVEKLPAVLKQGVPKEEVEGLKQKLESIGCTINLK